MVDLETIGKNERQLGRNAVINHHDVSDVLKIKNLNLNSKLICRVNPFYEGSFNEISLAINNGADYIMIPMIENISAYKKILDMISGRCKVIPLIETPYSLMKVAEIIDYFPIDQIHFGLNDLRIGFKMHNLFEILFSNFFQNVIDEVKNKVQTIGIGGIGSPLYQQQVYPELVIKQIKCIGGNSIIMSRSFFQEGYIKKDILEALIILDQALDANISDTELSLLKVQINNLS
jgi:hypothetical protein